MVLPAATLGAALAAILTRMVRGSMLEELSSDYVRTARAKGLSTGAVLFRHAFRNALIPIITILGLQFGTLLAGTIEPIALKFKEFGIESGFYWYVTIILALTTVAFLMLHSKKGMSALQIKRMVFHDKASYETVWYMCTRIRAAMNNDEFSQLIGIVEVDETYIGGLNKNRHRAKKQIGGGPVHKIPVIGAIARKGNVICKVLDDTTMGRTSQFIRKVVDENVSLIATDESASYQDFSRAGFKHETVDHKAGEYVNGVVHTNNLESFWSLLKRGVMGSYHKVSKKYLPLYLAEFTFRHNHRKNRDMYGTLIAGC